ncbi:hypothetical protein IO45_09900, partial [Gallibacterium anatis]
MARDHPILGGGVESTKITTAKEAVKAAEDAYQQAKNLLDKAKEDNQITAEQKLAFEKANQAIKDAKTKAEEALNNLPKDKQEELKERLDAVNPIEIPKNSGGSSTDPEQPTPTDPEDNKGNTGKDKPDVGGQDKDPALENAEKLVKEAEDAETKAEEALKEANKDGVISQEEKGKLDSLNEEITKAKKDAEDALKDLPEGEIKDNLKERLDDVDNVSVPTVNDSNGNGIDDTTDISNAQDA